MAATALTSAELVARIVECAAVLDEQEVERTDQWMIISPYAFKMIRRMLNRKPLAKRPGPRGRRLALKRRRAQR